MSISMGSTTRCMSEETWKQAYRLHIDGVVVDDGIGRAEDDDAWQRDQVRCSVSEVERRGLTAVCSVDDGIVLYHTLCAAQADPICPLIVR